MWLEIQNVRQKIEELPSACRRVLTPSLENRDYENVPFLPGRDVQVASIISGRHKPKLSQKEGQARLLHDLASIELQAMELAYRSLIEFPHAPIEFREELAALACSEASHLQLCLEALEKLDFSWGHWPVHLSLWSASSHEDTLLDRLIIVHRYLEGGGLDAGVSILRRISGVAPAQVIRVVQTIVDEEVGHVSFGSAWYRHFCQGQGLHPETDFRQRLGRLMPRIPRRLEKVDWTIRRRAGFTDDELHFIEELQRSPSKR